MLKVKAHLDLASAGFPWHDDNAVQLYFGNSLGDAVVGIAAEAAQVRERQRNSYPAERAVQRNVLRRAVDVATQVFAGKRAMGERQKVRKLSKAEKS